MTRISTLIFLAVLFVSPAHALECERAGCSGEICTPKDSGIASPCMWQEKFACYKTAVCAAQRGPDGKRVCGWRSTPQLQQCLQNTDDKAISTTQPPAPVRNIQ